MKKIYLVAASFVLCAAGMAQSGVTSEVKPIRSIADQKSAVKTVNQADRPSMNAAASDNSRNTVIWEDDFSEPSNWIFTDQSPSPYGWVITTGEYTPSIQAGTPFVEFESTTSDNGYAFIDSDGSPWTGDGAGEVIGQIRTASAIDLSGEPAVILRYENNYRWYQDTRGVRVSGDNGETWTDFDLTDQAGYPNEQDSENPDIVLVNVSNVIGGQSEVLIEFYYRDNNIWAWYWAIDDVSLIVPTDNDLRLSNAYYNKYDSDSDDFFFYSFLEYSTYDENHIFPMFFNGEIENVGALEQTNVQLEVVISNESGVIETLTSDPVSLAPGETIYAETPEYMPPSDLGDYQINYNVIMDAADDNPENNVAARSFTISEEQYARDNGIMQNADGAVLEAGADAGVGLGYGFAQDDEIHCLGVAIHEASYGPISIVGNANNVGAEGLPSIAETQSITVDEAELNNLVDEPVFTWLPFVEFDPFTGNEVVAPFLVTADDEWGFSVRWTPEEIDGDPDNIGGVYIGYGSNPAFGDFANFVWGPQTTTGTVCNPCNAGVTNNYMLRLGMSAEFCQIGVGVEEIENLTIEELFPNPTTGQTTLSFSLLETSEVQVYLFDAQGRIVMNDALGTQPVGEYRFDYNFSDQAAGMYTMSIMVGDKAVNKKLVIK